MDLVSGAKRVIVAMRIFHGYEERSRPPSARRSVSATSSRLPELEPDQCSACERSRWEKCGSPAVLLRRLQVRHSVVVDASRWGDDVRLFDLEPRLTCQVCGHRRADIRPLFEHARMGTG